jgi:putative flippase GtrA
MDDELGRSDAPTAMRRSGPLGVSSDLGRYGRFLLVGLTGALVNLAVFVLVVDSLSGQPISNFVPSILRFASTAAPQPLLYLAGSAGGFGVATLWNFTWNNLWTFRTDEDRRHSPSRRLELYFGVSLGSLAVNEVVLFATQLVLPPLFGQGIGIVAGSVVGFFGNRRYTFATVPRGLVRAERPTA